MNLEHRKLARGNAASRIGGLAFKGENGKPLKVAHTPWHGNDSKNPCSCSRFKRQWANDCMKSTAWDVGSSLGSAHTSQAVGWMSLDNTWQNAYSPPTLDRWIVNSGATYEMTIQ